MNMINEMLELLERRQEQILDKMTDRYGRFKSSDCETFYEGYVECMQDVYKFFEDKERDNQND